MHVRSSRHEHDRPLGRAIPQHARGTPTAGENPERLATTLRRPRLGHTLWQRMVAWGALSSAIAPAYPRTSLTSQPVTLIPPAIAFRRLLTSPAMLFERFGTALMRTDSLAEEKGFEPSVPRESQLPLRVAH